MNRNEKEQSVYTCVLYYNMNNSDLVMDLKFIHEYGPVASPIAQPDEPHAQLPNYD